MLNVIAALLAAALIGAAAFAAAQHLRNEPPDDGHDATPNATA